MDPLSFASLTIEVVGLAKTIVQYGSLFEHVDEVLMVYEELPILIGFLSDIKNTFLNAREEPPHAAKLALDVCYKRLGSVETEIHRSGGLSLNGKKSYRWMVRPWRKTKKAYIGFKESAMLLKDICTFFMLQQNELQLAHFRQEVSFRFMEFENTLAHQFDDATNQQHTTMADSLVRPLHQISNISGGVHHDIDSDSLLLLQRTLQLENPNSTVFTAVLCPETTDGTPIKFAVARVLLDTGSDVNIISEKYLIDNGMSHLITQIPENEQVPIGGIEEQVVERPLQPSSMSRKVQIGIFSSAKNSTPEARKKVQLKESFCGCPRRSETPLEEEAEQAEFEQGRMRELEALREAYTQRENQKRLNSYITGALPEAGRAWTLDERRRALMPGSTSTASGGEGSSSMRITSMDEQKLQKQREASIKSGTMQEGSDDGSILGEAQNRN